MISVADIERWDLAAIAGVFDVARDRQMTMSRLGDNLDDANGRLGDWQGLAGDAFRAELGKIRTDIDAQHHQSLAVARAVGMAELRIARCKSDLGSIKQTAAANGWTITPAARIDIGTTGRGRARDLAFISAWQSLQQELDKLMVRANRADADLANAIRAVVGDVPLGPGAAPTPLEPAPPAQPDPPTRPEAEATAPEPDLAFDAQPDPAFDAGAEQRPDVTDVNDPGVTWNPQLDTQAWKSSWQNPLLTENPPGYTGPAGPDRDAAWQAYLADFTDQERGFLPKPDAVSDTGLKVLANTAAQLGVSYAWAGGDSKGPGKGQYSYDRGRLVYDGAYTYQDPGRVGFDCSGLTEYAAAQAAGADIGTYTGAQLESPSLKVLDNSGPLKPGDFLYYGTGTAHHVAVYVAPGIIINAPESGLPVELGTRSTILGPDPSDTLIRGRRLE
jgi:hypothetical protein